MGTTPNERLRFDLESLEAELETIAGKSTTMNKYDRERLQRIADRALNVRAKIGRHQEKTKW